MDFREKIDQVKNQLELGAVVVEILDSENEVENAKNESFLDTAKRVENTRPELAELMEYADQRWRELKR